MEEKKMTVAQNIGRRLDLAVRQAIRDRRFDDRGEGVISMAIAVLISAGIGGVLWVAFNSAAGTIGQDGNNQLGNISGQTQNP